MTACIIPNFPFIPPGDYDGGPSCLAMVMQFYGNSLTLEEIVRKMAVPPQPRRGSSFIYIEMSSKLLGFESEMYEGDLEDLREKIKAGFPLIVALKRSDKNNRKEGYCDGDYMVVWGYDDQEELIFAHAGKTPGRTISYNDFKKQWRITSNMTFCILPKNHEDVPGKWRHNRFGRY